MAEATYNFGQIVPGSLPTNGQNSQQIETKPRFHLQVINRETKYPTIADLAEHDPPPEWIPVFQFALPEIKRASMIAHSMGQFFPRTENVFRAFDYCEFPPKVVIFGQDPYHSVDNGIEQATGMCFDTRRGAPLQPSVRNIYQELQREYPDYKVPGHGDLSEWASQGVLLLNVCLTVMPHQPKSHMSKQRGDWISIWSGFIEKVINKINDANPGCIFLLWGADAQKLAQNLGSRSISLLSSHPSPFSAHRDSKDAPAFIGCNHFRQVNEQLRKQGKPEINWQISA